MAQRDEIVAWADEYLDLAAYPDYGPMGLQVVGAPEVRKIACGVSASRELFERAAEAGAQMVLVHHGLLWDKEPRRVGPVMRERLRSLFDADLSLAAYHLAFESDEVLGSLELVRREGKWSIGMVFADSSSGWRKQFDDPRAELACGNVQAWD